jgi:uncharacterized protein (TIGR02246 family)
MKLIMKKLIILFILCVAGECAPRNEAQTEIERINSDYVRFWLEGNSDGVLSLFTEDSMLQPSGLSPVKGITAINAFWFPNDSSITTIHKFDSRMINLEVQGDLAHSTQETFLSWSYEKGDTRLSREQNGVALTVYQRQQDGRWKIWRQLWTDTKVQ